MDQHSDEFAEARREMVERAIAARGVRSRAVLERCATCRAKPFCRSNLREFAYEDSPLPIAAGQTISQPYIVAFMTEALDLQAGERVLEIGTGSGYAAAVLAEIAGEVYTVERIGQLAEKAASVLVGSRLRQCACAAWRRHAGAGPSTRPMTPSWSPPGGPKVPESLKQQLKIGGRLVIPVGTDPRHPGAGARHAHLRDRIPRARISPTCGSCR